MAKCCIEPVTLHRIEPETGRPQISIDNGATWQSDPEDVQNKIQLLPPPVRAGSSSTKCNAATNAADHVDELIVATGENLTTASTVFGLAVGVAEAILAAFLIFISAGALTAPVTAVATAIWVAATELFSLGIAAYNAYWTTDKQDAIFCIIYCNIGADGQFTETQYQSFRSEVYATLPASPALDIVMTAINAGGAIGLSQMASYGSGAIRDCDSCTECDECTSKFFVYHDVGDVIGVGDGWIEYQSVSSELTGGQSVAITTNNSANCCYISHVDIDGVPGDAHMAYALCGESVPEYGASFPHNSTIVTCTQNCNTVLFYRDTLTSYTIKVYFAEEPCL
jgi:hypothetical protein